MRAWILVGLSLIGGDALAGDDVQKVTWDLLIDGHKVGTRTATVTTERKGDESTRVIESYTQVNATLGPISLAWRQRLTSVSDRVPASFQSKLDENGDPRNVSVRWQSEGWSVSLGDRRGNRTQVVAPYQIDLSTADLIDPGSRWRLDRYTHVKVLSAETGDIWEGPVEALGSGTVEIGVNPVAVEGWAWTSPEGRSTFWYSDDGWLVHYEMRVLGHTVEGVLTQAPPAGPDAFAVSTGNPKVEVLDL